MAQGAAAGWVISDVERLIGLPRRYIQRACYSGKDGAAILSPPTRGRERVYGVSDLATLYLVALWRDPRYSRDRHAHTLPEVRDQLEAAGTDVSEVLAAETELLREQLEEVADRYLKAQGLAAALAGDADMLAALAGECEGLAEALDVPRDERTGLPGLPAAELLDELGARGDATPEGTGGGADAAS